MSSETAIVVENISKSFHTYEKPRDRLLQSLFGSKKTFYKEFKALQDIGFSIQRGETVGIVGRNGSGKSTLLQIICGTLNQTSGMVSTSGRIAALLELGSGFNPDFTGRENVFLNARVLGLSHKEIEDRYQSIVDFAEIGDFIDQPIKTYSSGMLVRLAFSVAINVDPVILVVDEALSVGDELFQRKCFSRIEQIKKQGSTILFVSHSGSTVIELCDRAILIDHGELLFDGDPKTTIGLYQKLLYATADKQVGIREEIRIAATSPILKEDLSRQTEKASQTNQESLSEAFFDANLKSKSTISYEQNGARILQPMIVDDRGRQVNCLVRGESYRYKYDVEFLDNAENVRFGMLLKTTSGIELGGAVSSSLGNQGQSYHSGEKIEAEFSFTCNLNTGIYYLNAGVVGVQAGKETYLHRHLDLAIFRVIPVSNNRVTCHIDFNCAFSSNKIEILEPSRE
ncbi:ABC transporter ATP-binding protein [Pseudomonas sp. LABIM340]|uniref:ABC transporter ATP-binding protein n=1 Tax=Pseudomonas sp. LABIM340 TaxID=3156585 RepID=UPI0032AEAA00